MTSISYQGDSENRPGACGWPMATPTSTPETDANEARPFPESRNAASRLARTVLSGVPSGGPTG